MRNREPRVGRASATKNGLIFSSWDAKPPIKDSAGSAMVCWYRALLFANHSRSLFRFNWRRNVKTSGLKKAASGIAISRVPSSVYRLEAASLDLPPHQHGKLNRIVNCRLQLRAGLDGLSPEPNGGNHA